MRSTGMSVCHLTAQQEGRDASPAVPIIDSQTAKGAQKRGFLPRCFGHNAGKKITPPRDTVVSHSQRYGLSMPCLCPQNFVSSQ
jgi:hypothetical protein